MSMLYDANAATARLKSFPNRTYRSLMCCSSTCKLLHELRASSSCLVETSRRVTADSTAGCRFHCTDQDSPLIYKNDGDENDSHDPSRYLFRSGHFPGHSWTIQLRKWIGCRLWMDDLSHSLLVALSALWKTFKKEHPALGRS
jgi:hypothetical protein